MNTSNRTTRMAAALLIVFGAGACRSTEANANTQDLAAQIAARETLASGSAIDALPDSQLPESEIESLAYLREEEKLAHDVYVTLYEEWQTPIFQNISRSETTHTKAVEDLLEQYGIADPADGNDVGVFTNPDLQELYFDLIDKGSESLVAALEVGAFIEELDILDLQERASSVADIAVVYERLEQGSRNHLRAFIRILERQGVTYIPQLMDVEEFDAIISTPTEQGKANEGSGSRAGRGGYRGGRTVA